MPFRFAGVTGPWNRRSAPLLGEHNTEVLGEILGLDEEQLRQLEEARVIGSRPAGL
jgi:crotonobetainyl-CoA:carnitine CoA-transferase CaiB-like acyl-CoA transferase